MSQHASPAATPAAPRRTAGLFDLRWIIALLFGIYGIVVTVMGIAFTSAADLAKDGGTNVNLWTGIPMLVFAILMAAWARWRPVVFQPASAADADVDMGGSNGDPGGPGED
jgi:hypothetical protein